MAGKRFAVVMMAAVLGAGLASPSAGAEEVPAEAGGSIPVPDAVVEAAVANAVEAFGLPETSVAAAAGEVQRSEGSPSDEAYRAVILDEPGARPEVGEAPVATFFGVPESETWHVSITPSMTAARTDGTVSLPVARLTVAGDGGVTSQSVEDDGVTTTYIEGEGTDPRTQARVIFYCYIGVEKPHPVLFGTYVMHSSATQACNLPGPSMDSLALIRTPGGTVGSSTNGGNRTLTPFGYFWDNQVNRAVVGTTSSALWVVNHGVWAGTYGLAVADSQWSYISAYNLKPA